MLTINAIDYRVGGRVLFAGASAQIETGHKVGLIGRNGVGKTTLFRMISGEIEPDRGEISLPRHMRLGLVAQETPGGNITPHDMVLASDINRQNLLAKLDQAAAHNPEHLAEIEAELLDIDAATAPSRAAIILAGLGFDETQQHQPMQSFSGGWRMRVALAACLFSNPDVLLLDEPTNHLDLEAAIWLEGFLQNWRGTLLVISHDRDFLNNVTQSCLHIEGNKLTLYRGNYDRFERTRAERIALTEAQRAKQIAQREHMMEFVNRFRAQATKARQAQSRLKAIEKLSPIAAMIRDPEMVFNFPEPKELAPPIITIDDASVGYDGRPILKKLNLRIDPEDRIALVGANGNGKTTLARMIGGFLAPMSGTRLATRRLKVGYFAQHQVEELNPDQTALQHLAKLVPDWNESALRGYLGRFGFGGELALSKIGVLSGGEKARLTLALITQDAPHVLILDEPTNHLDIDARAALIEALTEYKGVVIIVSHDRHLVEHVADELWLVEGGTVERLSGDLASYRQSLLRGSGGKSSKADKNDKKSAKNAASVPQAKPNSAAGQESANPGPGGISEVKKRLPPSHLQKNLRETEFQLDRITAAIAKIDQKLADPNLYEDKHKSRDLAMERQKLSQQLAETEAAWQKISEMMAR
ncbi:MAG: ABC-F family ATP-binding cassette domain-containing protein [Candidatus Symbiobacter sp.]|nr:ABC-F family ATP-binding cassette domain-containing protein [Candidatus Symbiobacter sp.]